MTQKTSTRRSLRDTAFKISTRAHRAIFRLSRGRLFGRAMGMPVLELMTIGRRSGAVRATMLTTPIIDAGYLVLVASNGGDTRDPVWYHNLCANPQVEITMYGKRHPMRARVAAGSERAGLWRRVVSRHAVYSRYQERAGRSIPIVILEGTVGPAAPEPPT